MADGIQPRSEVHISCRYTASNWGSSSHKPEDIKVRTESCAQIHINCNLLKMNNWMMQYLSKHWIKFRILITCMNKKMWRVQLHLAVCWLYAPHKVSFMIIEEMSWHTEKCCIYDSDYLISTNNLYALLHIFILVRFVYEFISERKIDIHNWNTIHALHESTLFESLVNSVSYTRPSVWIIKHSGVTGILLL